eukprot:COSAG05_NODE_6854_length_892_cov_1.335435_1_plen_60_part_01
MCYGGQCYEGKGTQSKAQCDADCKKGPPSGGPDSWDSYEVAEMSVMSVVGGRNKTDYQKV